MLLAHVGLDGDRPHVELERIDEDAPLCAVHLGHSAYVCGVNARYYRSSGQEFGLVLRGVVVYHVPGVPGTVCRRGLAAFRGRESRARGPYRIGTI